MTDELLTNIYNNTNDIITNQLEIIDLLNSLNNNLTTILNLVVFFFVIKICHMLYRFFADMF